MNFEHEISISSYFLNTTKISYKTVCGNKNQLTESVLRLPTTRNSLIPLEMVWAYDLADASTKLDYKLNRKKHILL